MRYLFVEPDADDLAERDPDRPLGEAPECPRG
jgi:hypothetical protein